MRRHLFPECKARPPKDERCAACIARLKTMFAIQTFLRKHGYAPTFQELADLLGLKSRGSLSTGRIHWLVTALPLKRGASRG